MTLRFGFDVGTHSIGWAVLALGGNSAPCGIVDMGVRLYADGRDPQSGTSLAVDRRVARGMRRRRDRYLKRRRRLIDEMVRLDLMPEDRAARKALEALDPYELRARGLDQALSRHELGRALFHLNQRRGFKSNRKAEGDTKESGKIKDAIRRLKEAMAAAGARTVGEFLWHRHRERKPVRVRLEGEGAKAAYDFYLQRELLEAEFDQLWAAQAAHDPGLSEAARESLRRILFFQRPLRPVDPGKCALLPADQRAPRALPQAQRFRIYQEIANLRVIGAGFTERPITLAERDVIARRLHGKREVRFKALHTALKLAPEENFNLQDEKRDRLKGDETAAVLAHKDRFGKDWHEIPGADQEAIVEHLLAEEDEDALIAWLVETWGLEEEHARRVAAAPLPVGYARLGREALARIVPILASEAAWTPDTGEILDQPIGYAQAAERAGYHHSDRRPEALLTRLPYYGVTLARHVVGSGEANQPREQRFGRIPNPTVHIELNQLRRLVNALIEAHGPPAEIVVELVRDLKQGREATERLRREQAENQKRNEDRREKLREQGLAATGDNLVRLRLWEELNPKEAHDRRCVYTNEQISLVRLFTPEVEIDHILPFSQTLDNSAANRIVCLRHANRAKANRPPHEAFGESPVIQGHHYQWDQILVRAEKLPNNKRWRFGPEAMARYREENVFLDRQLTDTAYLARLTRQYLQHICHPDRVWVTPGRLTALLRGKWGLNALLADHNVKDRRDHRHHAIDAFVIACTTRGLLKQVADAAKVAEDRELERIIGDMPPPFAGYDREELRRQLERLVVSHKPDQGTQGKLHEETAYGLIKDPSDWDGHNLVYRKPFSGLNRNEVERIRDQALRQELLNHIYYAELEGKPWKQALSDFNAQREARGLAPIRRVRLLKKEEDVIKISDRDGVAYKAYSPGDNHRVEIYQTTDGRWRGEAVTVFQANQPDHQPAWQQEHPDAHLVMKIHKGDLLKLDYQGREAVMRVWRLEAKNGRLRLAAHHEGGELQKRHDDPDDPFRWFFCAFNKMKQLGARPVRVDVLGRVADPGPPR